MNKTNESKEHSNEVSRRTSPQIHEDYPVKKVSMTHRTSSKKSVTDYSQAMFNMNSRNFITKKLETKSSMHSLKNLNFDNKSECGS